MLCSGWRFKLLSVCLSVFPCGSAYLNVSPKLPGSYCIPRTRLRRLTGLCVARVVVQKGSVVFFCRCASCVFLLVFVAFSVPSLQQTFVCVAADSVRAGSGAFACEVKTAGLVSPVVMLIQGNLLLTEAYLRPDGKEGGSRAFGISSDFFFSNC